MLTDTEMLFIDGMRFTYVQRGDDGKLQAVSVPQGHGVVFFVRVPGYKLAE